MSGTLNFSLGAVDFGGVTSASLEYFLCESQVFGPPAYDHEKWRYTVSPKIVETGQRRKSYLHFIITQINSDVRVTAKSAKIKMGCIFTHIKVTRGTYSGEGMLQLNLTPSSLTIDVDISQIQALQAQGPNYQPTLSVTCDITLNLATSPPMPIGVCDVLNDYSKLFSNQEFGDVTVICGEEKFKVYKGIICSRSRVLRAAFENDMTETRKNTYVIEDMTPDVVKEMLSFLYTGQVSKIDEMADSLLVAAEKYDIPALKNICQQEMVDKISLENATHTLIIADQNNAAYLRGEALSFIAKKGKKIKNDESFKTLMPHHPHLLLEVYNISV